MTTYTIPVIAKDELEKKLKKFQKKANTYGNKLEWTFGDEKVVTRNIYSVGEGYKLVKTGEEKVFGVEINIESDIIRKDGYTVVAGIEHFNSGNIVILFDENTSIDLNWYTMQPYCEHCSSRHAKRYTFIVKDESGSYKQVGKSCLKDYCGIDPKMMVSAQDIHDLITNDYNIDDYDFRGSGEYAFDALKAIAIANDIIKEYGYVKSCEDNSTKTRLFIEIGKTEPSEESQKLAKEMKEVLTAMDYSELTDFLCTIKTMIQSGYIRSRAFGYIAYAPIAYQQMKEKQEREQIQKQLRDEAKANSNYVGNVGEKITTEVKESKLITSWQTMYGMKFLYKFTTPDNNILVWFSSRQIPEDMKKITGTVKEQKEYDGEKQTILTRCKAVM